VPEVNEKNLTGGFGTELECKICYCAYTLGTHRPKVLECCHRLCAKCLVKIQDLGESPPCTVVCPFCRYVTRPLGDATSSLPDDYNLLTALALGSRNQRSQRNLRFHQDELLLNPRHLSSLMGSEPTAMSPSSASAYSSIRGSPNFVVITIMEPPPAPSPGQDQLGGPLVSSFRSSSQDSLASVAQGWNLWNCASLLCQTSARALVWVLGLLYFSSLPMGVYLLIMQQTTVGVLLVSLVPASLVMVMVYGFCQCICQEVWNCMPPSRDHLR
uniref:E3 ubiquitin-protein ligase RNF182 n=1 Tax=Hippocampus comes TaxID=109280 RepID=A0A3Q2XXC4_HIPCM